MFEFLNKYKAMFLEVAGFVTEKSRPEVLADQLLNTVKNGIGLNRNKRIVSMFKDIDFDITLPQTQAAILAIIDERDHFLMNQLIDNHVDIPPRILGDFLEHVTCSKKEHKQELIARIIARHENCTIMDPKTAEMTKIAETKGWASVVNRTNELKPNPKIARINSEKLPYKKDGMSYN